MRFDPFRASTGANMIVLREFEFIPNRGGYVAVPFGMDGDAQGGALEQAVEMAADWLHMVAIDALIHGTEIPDSGIGNEPREGERAIAVAVSVNLSDAPAMTAAEAARELGVSTARMAQMYASGQLASWKVGATRMVARESIEERVALAPKAGRPCSREGETNHTARCRHKRSAQ